LVALLLSAFGTPTDAQIRNCQLEINSQYYSDGEAMQEFLRCLNNRITDLHKTNNQLQRRIAKLEAVAGNLPTAWSNEDGVITEEPGRPIGNASFLLSARSTGGANSLAIEQRVLEEVCGTSGGCTLTIAMNQLSLFDKKPKESAVSGPCQLTYKPDSGDWAVSGGCGGAPQSGIDGDGGLGSDGGNSVEIAAAGGACILADSGLSKTVGGDEELTSDRSKGLFLIAMPSRQSGAERRFQCELSFE
jgi:hypothetical protein